MAISIDSNKLKKCEKCSSFIDQQQYYIKNGLCYVCRTEKRKQSESVKEKSGNDID